MPGSSGHRHSPSLRTGVVVRKPEPASRTLAAAVYLAEQLTGTPTELTVDLAGLGPGLLAKGYSIRELDIDVTERQNFIGSTRTIADTIDENMQADAADDFIPVPHITPDGLGEFADNVVPPLQEKGVLRTEHSGTTLRDHLGLRPLPVHTEPAA